jgi:hypothetical protein
MELKGEIPVKFLKILKTLNIAGEIPAKFNGAKFSANLDNKQ